MISDSYKMTYYFYRLYDFFSLIQIREGSHQQKLSPRFCALRESRALAHFLSYKTNLSQIFFLLFPELLLLSSYIKDSVYLKTMKLLFCFTTAFNITRINYSNQRPLVTILQRKLIGKTKKYTLSNITGESGAPKKEDV